MSDFKFACPSCGQSIVSDTSNAGMNIACPVCQTNITIPKPPAAAPSGPGVPTGPGKLHINKTAHHAAPPPPSASGLAPNAAPAWGAKTAAAAGPMRKRQGTPKWLTAVVTTVIVLGLLAGGGYAWKKYSDQKAQEAAEKAAADAQAKAAAEQQAREAEAKAKAMRADWRMDVEVADFPDRAASGKIHAVNFTAETVLFQNGALTLRQTTSSSRQFVIILPVKMLDMLGGKSFDVAATNIEHVPQVTMNWKDDATSVPGGQTFRKGYAMKLQFGDVADGKVSANIYLSMPDKEQSFVAGHFTIMPPQMNGQPAMGQPSTGETRMKRPKQT